MEQVEVTQHFPKQTNPQVLFSWKAPIRAYKRQPAGVFTFYAVIAVLLTVIMILFREYFAIVPIWALMFVVYALTVTPPVEVENSLTKFGIQSAGETYTWDRFSSFYFLKKFDYHTLTLLGIDRSVHPVYIVIPNNGVKEQVIHYLSEHLIYQESPNLTLADKMAYFLTTLMPEVEHPAQDETHEGQPPAPPSSAPTEAALHLQ